MRSSATSHREVEVEPPIISTLLYANDIVLISCSPKGLQRHIDALLEFCTDRELTINLGMTKVMVFNISIAWITCYGLSFIYRDKQIEILQSCVYLEVTFIGPRFNMDKWHKTG